MYTNLLPNLEIAAKTVLRLIAFIRAEKFSSKWKIEVAIDVESQAIFTTGKIEIAAA